MPRRLDADPKDLRTETASVVFTPAEMERLDAWASRMTGEMGRKVSRSAVLRILLARAGGVVLSA